MASGIKTYFFWPPVLLKDLHDPQPYEQDYLDKVNPYKVKAFEATWAAAEKRFAGRESENIYYIADLFKNSDIPIDMDMGHTEYNGNMVLAEKMYQVLKDSGVVN